MVKAVKVIFRTFRLGQRPLFAPLNIPLYAVKYALPCAK